MLKRYKKIVDATKCWHLDVYADRFEFYLETTGKPRIDDKAYTPNQLSKSPHVASRLAGMYGINSMIEICKIANFLPQEIFDIRLHITEKIYKKEPTDDYRYYHFICRNDQVYITNHHKEDSEARYFTIKAPEFRADLKLHEEIIKIFGNDCLQDALKLFDATFLNTSVESELLSQRESAVLTIASKDKKWNLQVHNLSLYVESNDNSETYFCDQMYFRNNHVEIRLVANLFGSAALNEVNRIFNYDERSKKVVTFGIKKDK